MPEALRHICLKTGLAEYHHNLAAKKKARLEGRDKDRDGAAAAGPSASRTSGQAAADGSDAECEEGKGEDDGMEEDLEEDDEEGATGASSAKCHPVSKRLMQPSRRSQALT